MKSILFSPLSLRSLVLRNRIFVSPMCQYSSPSGFATDWHLVHLGSRAVGGAGLVMVEATAVSPEGRISPDDSGLWSDAHVEAFRPITRFIREQGAVPAIQLAHAGRKASTPPPWKGGLAVAPTEGGWEPVAPSPLAFDTGYPQPRMLQAEEINGITEQFVAAARRAHDAGFQVIELHMAHGYLFHEFLSPLSNHREDQYGGSAENRLRFSLDTARAVRAAWPHDLPLLVRLSCSDWVEGGWTIDDSVQLSAALKELGVDMIDCSSGGNVPRAGIPVGPGYQVRFAEEIRRRANVPTGAVGIITDPAQAEQIVRTEQADAVLLARELLRNPYWPLHAAHSLGVDVPWPVQYERAKR